MGMKVPPGDSAPMAPNEVAPNKEFIAGLAVPQPTAGVAGVNIKE